MLAGSAHMAWSPDPAQPLSLGEPGSQDTDFLFKLERIVLFKINRNTCCSK